MPSARRARPPLFAGRHRPHPRLDGTAPPRLAAALQSPQPQDVRHIARPQGFRQPGQDFGTPGRLPAAC
ncbi:hypothetical protein AZA_62150 [Nitrospirillum viridazoti Y2]|nr:hypothetical protein AZA_62150 [Nitrospirillum amazonense Y2]